MKFCFLEKSPEPPNSENGNYTERAFPFVETKQVNHEENVNEETEENLSLPLETILPQESEMDSPKSSPERNREDTIDFNVHLIRPPSSNNLFQSKYLEIEKYSPSGDFKEVTFISVSFNHPMFSLSNTLNQSEFLDNLIKIDPPLRGSWTLHGTQNIVVKKKKEFKFLFYFLFLYFKIIYDKSLRRFIGFLEVHFSQSQLKKVK